MFNLQTPTQTSIRITSSQYLTPETHKLLHQTSHVRDKPQQKAPQSIESRMLVVQLKNQLVKMKEFVRRQLPEVTEIVTRVKEDSGRRNQGLQDEVAGSSYVARKKQRSVRFDSSEKRMAAQNQKLRQQLERSRSRNRQLAKTLHKQKQMVSKFYQQTEQRISKSNGLARSQKKIPQYTNNLKHPEMSNIRIDDKKVQSRRQRRSHNPRLNTSIYQTEAHSEVRVPTTSKPCHNSQVDRQTQQTDSQIRVLTHKMQQLLQQSRQAPSYSQKLKLRKQICALAVQLQALQSPVSQFI